VERRLVRDAECRVEMDAGRQQGQNVERVVLEVDFVNQIPIQCIVYVLVNVKSIVWRIKIELYLGEVGNQFKDSNDLLGFIRSKLDLVAKDRVYRAYYVRYESKLCNVHQHNGQRYVYHAQISW
jgi:hypothetical protein